MPIWPFKKSRQPSVRVQFIDVTGAIKFDACDMAVERLPSSFEAKTTMHLGADDWEVVEARPVTAAEFGKSGKLVLILQKVGSVQRLPPGDILYSLPTISNELPSMLAGSSKLEKRVLELHEDDWRQVEWVSDSLMDSVEGELAAIREIYAQHREPGGFRKLHVRTAIPDPLAATILTLEGFAGALGRDATKLDGVAAQGVAGLVANGFAMRLLSSIEVYGLSSEGRIRVIGFQNRQVNNAPLYDLRNLAAIAAGHQLLLVDWYRATIVPPEEESYRRYFVGGDEVV
jgi:hypothetical protein